MNVKYTLTDDVIVKNKTEIEKFIKICNMSKDVCCSLGDLELTLIDINPYQTRKLFELLGWEVDYEDENSTDRWYECTNDNYNFSIILMVDTDTFTITLNRRVISDGKINNKI